MPPDPPDQPDLPDQPGKAMPQEAELTFDYLLRRMRFKSDFPALSGAVTRIQALSSSDTENLQTLCDGILQDVALTQKLLRLVNTAHYRRAGSEPISTISRAVSLIGMAGVRNLALSLMLLEHMQDKAHAQQLKVEFLRSVMAGTLAGELCQTRGETETSFLGALFRSLGRLLVSYYLPDDAEQIKRLVDGAQGEPPLSAEAASKQVLGLSLDQLGVNVGRLWGLPDNLVACMADPGNAVPTHSLAARPERAWWLASLATQAADAMLDHEPAELGRAMEALSARYLRALELRPHELQDAAGRARQRLKDLSEVLNFHVEPDSPGERLLETYYVDAPHADAPAPSAKPGAAATPATPATSSPGAHTPAAAVPGAAPASRPPAPQALALSLADEPPGRLAPGEPHFLQDPASILTSGIQDITNTLVGTFRLHDVLQMILETLLRALDCRRVVFCLRDARSGTLLGRLALGEGGDQLKALFNVPLSLPAGSNPDLFSAVCLKNVDTLIADASAAAIVQRLPAWFRDQVQAPTFLLLPLVVKRSGQADMVLGLLYADKGTAGQLRLDEHTLSLLRTLRNQAVMAFKQGSSTAA